MKVLALDLALDSGYCIGDYDNGIILASAEIHLRGIDAIRADELSGLNAFLSQRMYFDNPDVIVVERPHLRGWGSYRLCSYVGMAEFWANHYHKKFVMIHTGTVKKAATGHGKASKEQMIEAANKATRLIQKVVASDNEADAICLFLAYKILKEKGEL